MEIHRSDDGRAFYKGVELDTSLELLSFQEIESSDNNIQWALHTNLGSLTVLDRQTGYGYGVRDTETGYRAPDGKFWLASGMVDVRYSDSKTIGEAIAFVKSHANTCIGK